MIDWGTGEYEHTATELMPAAERLVEMAGIEAEDQVLDLGCGTGNVALLAARTGAEVTAVDPAQRLVEVARQRLAAEGLDADLVTASAEDLPFPDGAFDVVISAFAVIFAPDAERAAAQLVRVLGDEGRALVSAWTRSGSIFEAIWEFAGAVAALEGAPAERRFDWSDVDAVTALFGDAGGAVTVSEPNTLVTPATSAEAFMARFESVHPVGMAFREALTAAGSYDEPRARAMERIRAGLSDGGVKSTYLVYTVTR